MSKITKSPRKRGDDRGHGIREIRTSSAAVVTNAGREAGGDRGQRMRETHRVGASVPTNPAPTGGRRRGQCRDETQRRRAAVATNTNEDTTMRKVKTSATPSVSSRRRGQSIPAARIRSAAAATNPGESRGDAVGRVHVETHILDADSIAIIRSLWRRRQAWHRAEKSLSLAVHAVCRQYIGSKMVIPDKEPWTDDHIPDNRKSAKAMTALKAGAGDLRKRVEDGTTLPGEEDAAISAAPLLAARAVLEQYRSAIEKELARLVKALPIAPWALAVPGIGVGSLMAIVGEAGDVGSYRSVSAFWKRMGVAVVGGERQRRKTGADGIEHGFSPERGAVSFNVGAALIGSMGRGPRLQVGASTEGLSPYQAMFVDRCRYLAARDPDEFARDPIEKDGGLRESFSAHCANAARRYVTKRFYRHLFAEWRRLHGQNHVAAQGNGAVEPHFQQAAE